jgi:hypothetical protein
MLEIAAKSHTACHESSEGSDVRFVSPLFGLKTEHILTMLNLCQMVLHQCFLIRIKGQRRLL